MDESDFLPNPSCERRAVTGVATFKRDPTRRGGEDACRQLARTPSGAWALGAERSSRRARAGRLCGALRTAVPQGPSAGAGAGAAGGGRRTQEPLAPNASEAGLPQLRGLDRRCVWIWLGGVGSAGKPCAHVEALQPVTQALLAPGEQRAQPPLCRVGVSPGDASAARASSTLFELSAPSKQPQMVVGQEAESVGSVTRLPVLVTSFFILMTHPAYVNRERRQQAHRS
uniref:uncharacterized protein LOC118550318 n=1 Tax=Halichoerus grypus TaxID=9711 RepID=UPI0016595FA8|nr:uncharacterized protein LOC118550318 [Halichoerus grypus]